MQFGSISKFGLLEMSRQRLKPTLSEGSSIPCPRCGGSGHIRDTESSALQILRIIQEESLKDSTAAVLVQVPVEVASFLLNEKRTEITKIELKQRINVLLVPNKSLDTPNYKLERLKHDDPRLDNLDASYKLAEEADDADQLHAPQPGTHQQAGTGDQGRAARRSRTGRRTQARDGPRRRCSCGTGCRSSCACPGSTQSRRTGRKGFLWLAQEPVRWRRTRSARRHGGTQSRGRTGQDR